ncbi:hypothetical protein FHS91_000777 [Sphingobium xanthum]|jgi:hypothetical protein|uniref:hypothetical protein n=1 Tax=Sphingobium xanthum TaxID=1387165 RepID=UPI001C8B5E3B|nr:hypothetical protein [Sphingobium xanthum]
MRDERIYVIETIRAFLNGTGGPWDWRAFITSSLRDAELDRIRRCAGAVRLPLDGEGVTILQDLIVQAELLGGDGSSRVKPWRIEAGALAGLLVGGFFYWWSYLPGAGFFHNVHLLVVPPALGAWAVTLRNSRMKVGAYDPRIVAQNRKGRV